jgi:hypothetical protein
MSTYTIDISDNYTPPEGPLDTNEAYLTYVLNRAAESYKNQYSTADVESGITAAREAYNASLPQPQAEEPTE